MIDLQAKAAAFFAENMGKTILSILIVVTLVGSHWFAYRSGKDNVNAENNSKVIKQLEKKVADAVTAGNENTARVQRLLDQEREKKAQVQYITKEITKYVTPEKDAACAADSHLVSLLNLAGMPSILEAGPGLSAYQGEAVDPVGYEELLTSYTEVRGQFETLRGKYNEWVDWYNEQAIQLEKSGKK